MPRPDPSRLLPAGNQPTRGPLTVLLLGILLVAPGALAEPPAPEPTTHIVQAGETVWRIARRYDATVEELVRANRIADVTRVFAGAELVIPGKRTPQRVPRAAAPPAASVFEALLARAESEVAEARFEQALATVAEARARLAADPGSPVPGAKTARLEVLAATAEAAFGRQGAALESFVRALTADPRLELDRGATSPKLLRSYDAARDLMRPVGRPASPGRSATGSRDAPRHPPPSS